MWSKLTAHNYSGIGVLSQELERHRLRNILSRTRWDFRVQQCILMFATEVNR